MLKLSKNFKFRFKTNILLDTCPESSIQLKYHVYGHRVTDKVSEVQGVFTKIYLKFEDVNFFLVEYYRRLFAYDPYDA